MKTLRVSMLRAAAAIAAISFSSIAIAQEAQEEEKGPPLPFITIEGAGGGAITPMAYLVNPAHEGDLFGKPSIAADVIGLNGKNLTTAMMTENIGGRLELGFAADDLSLGGLPGTIHDNTGVEIGRSDVWLYNFSLRGLAIKENADDHEWMPAITVGADFKVNEGIREINRKLGGALSGIGYDKENSVDFTLTATKTLPTAFFGKPLILTAGLRESEGAQLGLLGFSNTYQASFEGSVAILPFDKWLFAYEFRQHQSPYDNIIINDNVVVGDENNWHAFDAAYIVNKHTTVVGGVGIFGNLVDSKSDSAWWLQLKYEF